MTEPELRMQRGRVLVIDDDRMVADALSRLLSLEHQVNCAYGGREAVKVLAGDGASPFDVILCDLYMPGISGIDLFEVLSAEIPAAADRMVFLTGAAMKDEDRAFLEAPGRVSFTKSIEIEELRAFVRSRVRSLG